MTNQPRISLFYIRKCLWIMLAATSLLLGTLYAAELVQYPDNFRRWVHVGTGVITPDSTIPKGEQGMHHIFANPKAVEGYASGNFADGSVIVYELRTAQHNNGIIFEGERRRVDVMIKDSTQYKNTGGWHFERFWGDDQTKNAIQGSEAACFQCHTQAKAHGLVFSQLR